MNIDQKSKIVDNLSDCLGRSKIVMLADYKGLDVTILTNLRRELGESGSELHVIKNTLLRRASDNTDAALMKDYFKGPTAIVFGYDDPAASAKVLTSFAKDNEKFQLKSGVLNGTLLSMKDMEALASLPTREVLLAQVLATMNAVPASFVRTLGAIPGSLLNVLQAIKTKKEAC